MRTWRRYSPRRFGLKGLGRKHGEMAQTVSTPCGAFRLFPTPGAWEGLTAQGELGLGVEGGEHTPVSGVSFVGEGPHLPSPSRPQHLGHDQRPLWRPPDCAGCPPPRGADGSLPPRPAAEQPEGVH